MTNDTKPAPGDPIWSRMRDAWMPETVRGRVEDLRDRTPEQQVWDSAVGACAEYVRRAMHYDESVALPMLRAMSIEERQFGKTDA